MAISPKFKLKNPIADKPTSIRMFLYLNGQRFVYSIGPDRTILPSLWDQRRMRPISTKINHCIDSKEQSRNRTKLNKIKKDFPNVANDIANVETRIQSIESKTRKFLSLKEQEEKTYTKEELKQYLDNSLGLLKPIKLRFIL